MVSIALLNQILIAALIIIELVFVAFYWNTRRLERNYEKAEKYQIALRCSRVRTIVLAYAVFDGAILVGYFAGYYNVDSLDIALTHGACVFLFLAVLIIEINRVASAEVMVYKGELEKDLEKIRFSSQEEAAVRDNQVL